MPTHAERVSILVVDDEPSVRQALRRALTFEGYSVRTADDGRAALDDLLATPADAILLDVTMPGVDGLEVCRRLRAAGDHTPILMLTARPRNCWPASAPCCGASSSTRAKTRSCVWEISASSRPLAS